MQEEIRIAFEGAGVEYRGEDWAFFERFRHLVVAMNSVMNLTRLTEPLDFHIKHVLDSLLPFVAVESLQKLGDDIRMADLGSGAGFPGLVLARARPTWRVTLVERTLKKAAFLERTARDLDLHNVEVVAKDVRECGLRYACDLVTARAVGHLGAVTRAAGPLLALHGRLVHYKSGKLEAVEVKEGVEAAKRLKLLQAPPAPYTLPPDQSRTVVVVTNPPRRRKSGAVRPPS